MIKNGYKKVFLIIDKGYIHLIFARNKNLAIVFCTLLISACSDLDCDQKEIERQYSQNGSLEFVVSVKNCGATASEAYSIYVVKYEDKISSTDEIFRADKVNNLNVKWESENLIRITYGSARIFKFSNFQQITDTNGTVRTIKIIEHPQ